MADRWVLLLLLNTIKSSKHWGRGIVLAQLRNLLEGEEKGVKLKSIFSLAGSRTDLPLEYREKRPRVSVFKRSQKPDLCKSPFAAAAPRTQLSLSRGPLPKRQLSHTLGKKKKQGPANRVIRAIVILSNYCAVRT